MGYLICAKCRGYYELQMGESPEDFTNECNCGGNLKYVEKIDKIDLEFKNGSINVACPSCGNLNPNFAVFCSECGHNLQINQSANLKTDEIKFSKEFDLNIEEILEDWEVFHALREIIANALDEQVLTDSKDIKIYKDSEGLYHISDFGRGLKYDHLTQKENDEKLSNPDVIGKFGIGLKDALATFDRKGVKVLIKSKHGDIKLGKSHKHGFDDLTTLHAYISNPSSSNFVGTEFILEGVTDDDMFKAKDLFLKFSSEKVIEKTKYGDLLEKKGNSGYIYISGVKVAEEENFLLSYNITALTKKINKALNRERSNVGRTAYSDRVKSILLDSSKKEVAEILVNDLKHYSTGQMHDELKWIDVQEHASKLLNAKEEVIFLTSEELVNDPDMVEKAKTGGYNIISIPENLKHKLNNSTDVNGEKIRDLGQFYNEYKESFEYKFINPNSLNTQEKLVWAKTDKILELVGGMPYNVKEIKISETMQKDYTTFQEAGGLWDASMGRIIIKRSELKSLESYAGVLLHEVCHAKSGAADVTRDFEKALSDLLGLLASKNLKK